MCVCMHVRGVRVCEVCVCVCARGVYVCVWSVCEGCVGCTVTCSIQCFLHEALRVSIKS